MKKDLSIFNATVLVAALGYFVDVFDLLLFGMVRIPSLNSLDITDPKEVERLGLLLDNFQMGGMLLGGIVWGIIGDKKGRLTVLFGSILTYSLANFANGFVQNVETYALLRLIAGFGLAGELGAGVTLVSELLSKEKRGLGTALVASFGVLGAVIGVMVVKAIGYENWRYSYFLGGIMGFVLLFLRFQVKESALFEGSKNISAKKGDFSLLLKPKNLITYLSIILIALPIWYLVQFYAKYSPELAKSVGLTINPKEFAPNCIMYIYLGLALGDVSSGLLSNYLKSRKKAVLLFMLSIVLGLTFFWTVGIKSIFNFYLGVILLGFSAGYWALFMSIAAESFGTNLRSTVTGTAPNFVRGAVIGINALYLFFNQMLQNSIQANILLGTLLLLLGFWAWTKLGETYGKDLDFQQEEV
ncbi:MAG: MFS transporter [Flavobacteriaceae bacterium]|nr:MAG: MFS transporter [Flavobacteriaceae bacterium]